MPTSVRERQTRAITSSTARKHARAGGTARTIATPQAIRVRRTELLDRPRSVPTERRLRSLRLVALLLRRTKGLTIESLMRELGVSRPTLYRLRDDVIAASLPLAVDARDGLAVWRLEV